MANSHRTTDTLQPTTSDDKFSDETSSSGQVNSSEDSSFDDEDISDDNDESTDDEDSDSADSSSDYEDIIKLHPSNCESVRKNNLKQNILILGSKPNQKVTSYSCTKVAIDNHLNNSAHHDNNNEEISDSTKCKTHMNRTLEENISGLLKNNRETNLKVLTKTKLESETNKVKKIKNGNITFSVSCQHCGKQFKNKDVLIDHLMQTAKEQASLESKKQEFIRNLRKDVGFLVHNNKKYTDNTKERKNGKFTVTHTDVDTSENRKASLPINIELKTASKVKNKSEVLKTNIQENLHSKLLTRTNTTGNEDSATNYHIKLKLKLKDNVTKEYEVELNEEIINDARKISALEKNNFEQNNLDCHVNPRVKQDKTKIINSIDEVNKPLSDNITSSITDMPQITSSVKVVKLPEAKTRDEQSKLCKIKPFIINTQSKVTDTPVSHRIPPLTDIDIGKTNKDRYFNKLEIIKHKPKVEEYIHNIKEFTEIQIGEERNLCDTVPVNVILNNNIIQTKLNNSKCNLEVKVVSYNFASNLKEDNVTFFKCQNCSTNFLRRIECIKHIRNVENNLGVCDKNNISCENCGLIFNEKSIDLHIKKHHKINTIIQPKDEKQDLKDVELFKEDINDNRDSFLVFGDDDDGIHNLKSSFSKLISAKYMNTILRKDSCLNNKFKHINSYETISGYEKPSKRLKFEDNIDI